MLSVIVLFFVFFFNCVYVIMMLCFGCFNFYDKIWCFNKILKYFNWVINKKKCCVLNEMKYYININKVKINEISVVV